MEEPFYIPPGPSYEPGDIFSEIPIPTLKHPLEFFRASPNPRARGNATIFSAAERHVPQPGDTARGSFTKRPVILLSHGCELDAVDRDVQTGKTQYGNRYWLAAPVLSLASCGPKIKERTAMGKQPNKFLLPPGGPFGNEAYFVDLRKITPITVPYFHEGTKVASLSTSAVLSLQAHLGLFFSGLVLYVQPIPCPMCDTPIDPTLFIAASTDEGDID
jgi:hypothetical protein